MQSACWSRDYDELKRIANISTVSRETKKSAAESVLSKLYLWPSWNQEQSSLEIVKTLELITTVKSIFSLPAEINHLGSLFRNGRRNGHECESHAQTIQDDVFPASMSFVETLIRELAAAGKLDGIVPPWVDDEDDEVHYSSDSVHNILDELLAVGFYGPSAFYRAKIVQLLLEHCPSLLKHSTAYTNITQVASSCRFTGDDFQILKTLILAATTTELTQTMLSQSEMEEIFQLTFASAFKSQRSAKDERNVDNLSLLIDLFVTKCGVDPTCLLVDDTLFDLDDEQRFRKPTSTTTTTAVSASCSVVPLTIYYRYLLELGLDLNVESDGTPLIFHRAITQHSPVVPLFLEYGADETLDFEKLLRTSLPNSTIELHATEMCVAEMRDLFSQGLKLRAMKRSRHIAAVADVCGARYSTDASDSHNSEHISPVTTVATVAGLLPPIIELVCRVLPKLCAQDYSLHFLNSFRVVGVHTNVQ